MGLQFIQLELILGKTPSRSFRPVKSAEIIWQVFGFKFILGFHLLMMVLGASGSPPCGCVVNPNEQKLHYLEEALPKAPPATTTAAVRNAYTPRVAKQQEVSCLMLVSMTLKIQKNLEDRPAFEILQELKTMFQQQAEQELFETMERLGYPMPLVLGVNMILTSLLKDYDQKGYTQENSCCPNYRQGQIQKPKSQERGKRKQRVNGKSKLAYDPKHKIPHLLKRSILPRTLSAITLTRLDTRRGTVLYIWQSWRRTKPVHLAHQGLRGYRKLNKGALDLYVGNGHSAAVEAIRSFKFILPSGMILVLDNFSKDNICYFNDFPRDGIFEIDMHNHISNERSIYTCSNKKTKHSLDSTFLWHCCLSHINKKHIEKLQHDGLLESIDDESFDVCVSCISGKMARKPFTHASERADDLLRIIHSDSEDAQPPENTILYQNEVEPNTVKPQTDVIPIRRSARISQAPERYGFYIDAEEHELGYHEMQSMKDNQVWNLVNLPPNCKTVGIKWLFKKKTDMDANIHIYKAHLVAKGFTQTYEVDYDETFSLVADIKAIRILKAIAAYYDYEIWMDTSKRGTIPMQPNVDLSNTQGPSTPAEVKWMKGIPYASVVGAVDWKSSKQSTTAMSSMEAEYIAAMKAIWIRKFISGLGVVPSIDRPIDMYCDNTGAITIAFKAGVQRDDNLVDPFTKPMPCTKHVEHARSIGLRPAGSFM
ncbi:zinc finger, CCHC-type containing protein [Tanacetum coccineum]